MRRIRSADTKPEKLVRSIVQGLGYRYRLKGVTLPCKPDLVFSSRRKAIFVHGCFWHQHDKLGCRGKRVPRHNSNYWKPKLERNVARDAENLRKLHDAGWSSLVIWECELDNIEGIKAKVCSFLGDRFK